MGEIGHELQAIIDSMVRLGKEVEEAKPGDPALAAVVSSVIDLQGRLERVRSVMGPLMTDANREPTPDENAAASMERALTSLLSAAESRRIVG